MHLLYDSESFVVLHIETQLLPVAGDISPSCAMVLTKHGFEIVDKRSGKELFLSDSWAEVFHQQLQCWQKDIPSQADIEAALDSYSGLAQTPVLVQ
jgi:Protein of unknown function (DUF3567)